MIVNDKMRPNATGLRAAASMVKELKRETTLPKSGGLTFGKVTSTNPISVTIENRLSIGSRNIIISPFCVETKLNITHTHKTKSEGESAPIETSEAFKEEDKVTINGEEVSLKHTHTINVAAPTPEIEEAFKEPITLWRGLNVGDTVIIMVSADQQTYYILQRAGGIG